MSRDMSTTTKPPTKTEALKEVKAILDRPPAWDATNIAGRLSRHYGVKAFGYKSGGRP